MYNFSNINFLFIKKGMNRPEAYFKISNWSVEKTILHHRAVIAPPYICVCITRIDLSTRSSYRMSYLTAVRQTKNRYDFIGVARVLRSNRPVSEDDCEMATEKTNKGNVGLDDPSTVARAFYVCTMKKVLKKRGWVSSSHAHIATIRWRNWVIRCLPRVQLVHWCHPLINRPIKAGISCVPIVLHLSHTHSRSN